MEQRLSMVTLGVADLDRSRAFYERLGWRRHGEQPEVVFFQAGAIVFGLYGREALAKDAHVAADGSGFRGVALAFNTRSREEVGAILDEAEGAGATIVKTAEEAFWGGYSGYFADPDGHLWEVAWNPFWTIEEDGSVKLGG